MSAVVTAEGMSLGERCCVITTAESRSIRYPIAVAESKSVSKFNCFQCEALFKYTARRI
jgi:hypothetical protein